MKFPSLFTKTPSHQRFNYRPRYYDPQKEEQQERENRIRKEIESERGETLHNIPAGDYRSRIKGSFQSARRRSKPTAELNAVLIRLAVLLFISLFLIAFLTWGQPALYSLLLLVPLYIYFKFIR